MWCYKRDIEWFHGSFVELEQLNMKEEFEQTQGCRAGLRTMQVYKPCCQKEREPKDMRLSPCSERKYCKICCTTITYRIHRGTSSAVELPSIQTRTQIPYLSNAFHNDHHHHQPKTPHPPQMIP
jgi:hypothetical protein